VHFVKNHELDDNHDKEHQHITFLIYFVIMLNYQSNFYSILIYQLCYDDYFVWNLYLCDYLFCMGITEYYMFFIYIYLILVFFFIIFVSKLFHSLYNKKNMLIFVNNLSFNKIKEGISCIYILVYKNKYSLNT
jgi:hypothetical protein